MHDLLTRIAEHESLTRHDAARAMELMLGGQASPEQIAAFLVGLRARGETLEELVGLTGSMRSFAVKVDAPANAMDIVGTGGDRSGTFNISTAASLVCAGAGVTVAKHGNRSVSSKCGSADVLEALGVRTELGKEGIEYCLREAGIAFLFAPFFHPALKHVMPVRRALGVRTCFNILGPLCNPAGVRRQLIGAFSKDVARMMAHILVELGSESVVCVHAHDGLDEISLSGPTTVFRLTHPGEPLSEHTISPFDYGMAPAPLSEILGGDAARNAAIVRSILEGKPGAPRDIVVLNAAFALLVSGTVTTVRDGLDRARTAIDSGAAAEALERLAAASHAAP
ncbi:MAG: anthranilate phosphoribosyltransferase [Rhodothermales bacterium]